MAVAAGVARLRGVRRAQRDYALTFLDGVLAKVAGLTQGVYSSPRVTNLIFQYLDSVINVKACYK